MKPGAASRALPARADVLIVGAGMAGCALAAALAGSGLTIVVIEANALTASVPRPAAALAALDPRVSALNQATVQLLANVGAWQHIPEGVRAPYTHMSVWEEDGAARIEFDAGDIGADSLGTIVENRWIVASLLQVLAPHANVHLCAQQRLRGIERADQHLCVELDSGAQITTPLLIGADGARSRVREWAAIGGYEQDCGQRGIVATIRTSEPHRMTARQNFLQTGPLALLPLADPHVMSIVWSADNVVADELMAHDDAAFAARFERASEQCVGRVTELTQRQCFPLRQHHAASYAAPQLALVADAAHVVHPLAGQGINLGLADVRVLAEEIARGQARGLAPGDMTVLGRYQRRRRGDNELMLRAMIALQRLYGDRRPGVRLARNIGLRTVAQSALLKKAFMRQAMGLL
jgi:2-octaprenylphenol hydroxylase